MSAAAHSGPTTPRERMITAAHGVAARVTRAAHRVAAA